MTGRDIGIACDFLFDGGAETVVEALVDAFPDSTVYTTIFDPDGVARYRSLARAQSEGRLHSGFAQRLLSFPRTFGRLSLYHYYWLYFLTSAVQRTDRHDAVIVSCCAQSKLIRIPLGQPAIVYFHTPTRWLYPQLLTQADLMAMPRHLRGLAKMMNIFLRPLDRLGMRRLRRHNPIWLCNSNYIRDRVREIYGVDAQVVFPPVNTARFSGITRAPAGFFLYHGRLTFQKRVDVAIRGCLLARRPLKISGAPVSAEVQNYLVSIVAEAVSRDPGLDGLITFLGRTSDAELERLFAQCRALVFPPREDFGIAPIEAIASGVPVIAYKDGGALDYVQPGINGVFFEAQTGEALAEQLTRFDTTRFDPKTVAGSLPDLSVERFQERIREIVGDAITRAGG